MPSYIQSLNDRQREAVFWTEGPLIVLAGAGSGKTKMLTSRIAYLIDVGHIPPSGILAVTFTNKAATEMRERVANYLADSEVMGSPEIGTFHSVCVRLLRRELAFTPFTQPFVIYDDSDQLSLIKGVVEKLGIDDKAFNPKSFQSAINRAKCDALEPDDIEPAPHNLFERQYKRVYEQYQKNLFANNALDFGEIICMTYRLLRDNPEVREKYQRRFQYIHVDEYQDTNRAQYLLLSMLAGPKHSTHQNICVVGDEDQSIYKWRGADIRNILDFEQEYPGAKVVKLEQNYRSTKTIITAAGQVIRNNKSRKDKTLWTDNSEGIPIIRVQLPDERMEAEMVVSELKRLAMNEGYAFKDFAIFYRTHAQSRQFEDVLCREKIPYQIVGGLKFYDRKEIKDILAYFKVTLNPADSVNLKRIINVPARGIGKTTLMKLDELQAKLQQSEPNATFWTALQRAAADASLTSAGTARKIGQFVNLIQRLISERPKLMLSELYHLILDESGYIMELRKEGTEEAKARIENLEEFNTLVQEFEESHFQNIPENEREARKSGLLSTFLEETSLATDVADNSASGPQAAAVSLMTLHSSKGLEYPVVFLVGMEEGLFPSVRLWEENAEDEIEEERRLCYVGMTRAREILYMMHVQVRRIWGNTTYQDPARFFSEIDDNLIDFRDLTGGAGRVGRGFTDRSSFRQHGTEEPEFDDLQWERKAAVAATLSSIVGRKLSHPQYGFGTILSSEGSGHDQKVMVEFKGRDRRKFLLRYLKPYMEEES